MRNLDETTDTAPEAQPEISSEVASTDNKKKSIDEMLEEFNRNNPAKNQRKLYRGVF